MRAGRLLDPLYGTTTYNEWDAALVFSPEVQRLRYIRMCNINSLLVMGASEISRFEHTLGVFRLAQEWAEANRTSSLDAQTILAAALIHDVQTGPFGHSMEYIIADNPALGDFRHQDVKYGSENLYLQRATANVAFAGARFSARSHLGPLWGRVCDTINGNGPLGPLINGSIDLDNIDNVIRMSIHMGIAGTSDSSIAISLARDMQVDDGVISISSSSIDRIGRWQAIRHRMYNLLLHDWAEFSAKAMLTKSIELAVDAQILGADSWVLTDQGLLDTLRSQAIGENQEVAELVQRLTIGDLFSPLVMWRTGTTRAYKYLSQSSKKREIEARLGTLLHTTCIFHLILDKGKTDREISLLVRDLGGTKDFGRSSDEMLIGMFVSRVDWPHARTEQAISELGAIIGDAVPDLRLLPDPLSGEVGEIPRQLTML